MILSTLCTNIRALGRYWSNSAFQEIVGLPRSVVSQDLVLPFLCLKTPRRIPNVGSSHSIDPSVQVHNDVDCGNKDLGGDENDD